MIPGVELAAGVGTDAVRAVLAELSNERVLVIHDDATVTRRGLATMVAAHEAGADFVVPHTNEVGVEQSIGALPPADVAMSELDDLGRRLDARTVKEGRFSCILGTASELSDLGGSMVMPGSSLIRASVEIVAAPCAVAHDLSCAGKKSSNADQSPLLVASMIVRDEEDVLEGALESLVGVVDRVEVCDTGSVDGTIEVARAHGAAVTEIEWRNDFAWARNQALDRCRDARYVLSIDADERLVVNDPAAFRAWLATWSHEIDGLLIRINSDRGPGRAPTSSSLLRLARVEGASFAGAIHEVLRVEPPPDRSQTCVLTHRGVWFDHIGYLPEVINRRRKAERNIAIARAAYESDPTVKTKIDYARSLRMDTPDSDLAETLFRECLEELVNAHHPQARSLVRAVVAAYEMEAGRAEEAERLARLALEDTPAEDVAQVTLASLLVDAGRYSDLIATFRDLSQRASADPMFRVESNVARYHALVASALLATGQVEDAYDLALAALELDSVASSGALGEFALLLASSGTDPSKLVPLLARDPDGVMLASVLQVLPPAVVAQLCAAALKLGGFPGDLVKVGLTAAIVKNDDQSLGAIISYVGGLDVVEATGVMAVASRRGRADVAELIQRELLTQVAI